MKFLLHVSAGILLVFGVILVLAAWSLPPVIEKKIKEGLHENLQLKQGSTSYKLWKDNSLNTSVPQYMKFHFFNITNTKEVEQGKKPNLVEMGPYIYRKNIVKFNEQFSKDGDELTYNTYVHYTYIPEMSQQRDPKKDLVTTVNLAYQGVKEKLGNADWYLNLLADQLGSYSKEEIFTTQSVDELIWGYNSTLLEIVSKLQPGINTTVQLSANQSSFDDSLSQRRSDTINTGKKDINKVMQYVSFQGMTSTPFWGSEEAKKVQGTDGSQFQPLLKLGEVLSPWVDDAYRTLSLISSEYVTVGGVSLLRFKLSPTDFMNDKEHSSNAGYYQFGASGVGNLTTIKPGIFISSPHFLGADKSYADALIGIHPDPKLHETHIDVQPTTGLTMNVRKRLQINARVTPSIIRYCDVGPIYIPVVWEELSSELTPAAAKQFNDNNAAIVTASAASIGIKYVGFIVGGLLIGSALILIAIILRTFITRKNRGYSAIQ